MWPLLHNGINIPSRVYCCTPYQTWDAESTSHLIIAGLGWEREYVLEFEHIPVVSCNYLQA